VKVSLDAVCGVIVAAIAMAIAMAIVAPTARADAFDEVLVAHRGATTRTTAEGTLAAYKYAAMHRADLLEGDVRWTKDGSDPDTVGTMVIVHDATLNRVTNCSGQVSSWLWASISTKCRTDVGHQKILRLKDLLNYGNSVGKSFSLELKPSSITNAQAVQFWNAIKDSRVHVQAAAGALPALNKIKKLDAADPSHRVSYALVASGSGGWPSASTVREVGTAVYANLSIPASIVTSYQSAGVRVYLYTGRNEADYARVVALKPYGVVVDDVARYQSWRDAVDPQA
jgi:glycerophosphoryl diester phosphodiesterase